MNSLLYKATYNLRKFSSDGKSVFQSVSQSVCLYACLSVCLSLSQLVSLSVGMSVRLSVIHSVRLSACLFVSLCVSRSIRSALARSICLLPHCLKISLFSLPVLQRSSYSPFLISRSLTVRKKVNSVCRWLKFLQFIFLKGHKYCAIIFLNTKSTFLVHQVLYFLQYFRYR